MNPCYKDQEFAITKVLKSLVALTGGRSSLEATVCEKYLIDNCDSIERDILDSVASSLGSVASNSECEFL